MLASKSDWFRDHSPKLLRAADEVRGLPELASVVRHHK